MRRLSLLLYKYTNRLIQTQLHLRQNRSNWSEHSSHDTDQLHQPEPRPQ